MINLHICCFEAVGPIKRGTSYEAFKELVLTVGRFSSFEASENGRRYSKLCRDPTVEVIQDVFPWTKVKRKGGRT